MFEHIERLQAEGRHTDAIDALASALDEGPPNAVAWLLAARSFAAQERRRRLVSALRTALGEDPSLVERARADGSITAFQHVPRVALILETDPELSRAAEDLEAGHVDEARVVITEVLAKRPSASAWFLESTARATEGDLEGALEAAEAAMALAPDCTDSAFNRAWALAELGRDPEAIDVLQAGLALDPEHAELAYNLGLAARRTGRHDLERHAFERACTERPGNPLFRYKLAEAHALGGDPQGAVRVLRDAAEIDPGIVGAVRESELFARHLSPEQLAAITD